MPGGPANLPPDLTLDALAGPWRIHQRRGGHRWSIDDLLTAHVACLARPQATTHLDLGCGIGSVLMLCAFRFRARPVRHVGVEAQAQSVALCQASLALNGLEDRARVHHADFRNPETLAAGERFDLVTGTPPYVPVGTGKMPRDPQRAAARLELRGGVEAYALAAAASLAPGGVAVLCGDGRRPGRTEGAARSAGLWVTSWLELIPHPDKGPLFHVVTLASVAPEAVPRHQVLARHRDGRRTRALQDIRASFDMPAMPGDDDPRTAH
jgi:tRNA1(Val) A37 N6-methylase TrmN6